MTRQEWYQNITQGKLCQLQQQASNNHLWLNTVPFFVVVVVLFCFFLLVPNQFEIGKFSSK
jgi:hypothetical protein